MKFSVMTFMYRGSINSGNLTHRQLLSTIPESGAQGVEAFHQDFLDKPQLIAEYRALMNETGVTMAAVDVINNLVYNSPEAKTKARDGLRRALDVCLELGTGIAHVAGNSPVDGVTPADGRKMIAELLLEQADFADKNNLVLAIEDFDPAPTLICSKDDCLEILDLTGNRVKFVFDTGNFYAVGEQADKNLPECYERTVLCHFKDFVPHGDQPNGRRGTHLGQGVIPNQAVAAMLKERGYDGWISLESYPQDGAGALETIPREMETLKSWFA